MEIEKGRIINDFIEPNKKQYVIPVYQRNYAYYEETDETKVYGAFSEILSGKAQ